MKQSNIDDNYVRRKLRSLRRVSAPERAVKSLYQRIARQKAAYNEQGQTGLISGILSVFQYKKELLVTILATLLIAVPATFFLNTVLFNIINKLFFRGHVICRTEIIQLF